jgi:2-methylisocitrate lyase-like PEP mutase family enzyme
MCSVSAPLEMGLRELHQGPPFVIPNPWDVGSAKVLESLGFPAPVAYTKLRAHET